MTFPSKFSFTQHPASVGETYTQHFHTALSFAVCLLGAGLACLVHAVLPFLFERTASAAIQNLHERMILHRSSVARVEAGMVTAPARLQT